ncbi:WXG100 family type VII secretion target [Nonomuraea sp. NPDC052116]|uniref:WXG100 family type VII secretion target n=1 Tax=Nonomuraea sp. NPDC052116 TaxID=3155665 RepID=UPI00344AA754
MGDEWKPIRLYTYLGESKPGPLTTRAQIVSYLKDTDPDRIENAGNSYVKAAAVVHGKNGLEGALWKAAEELSAVWRGDGATAALEALRLLHASAAALGDAMEQTGKPMVEYAQQLRTSKTSMPGPTTLSTTTNVDNEPSTNPNLQWGTSAGYLVDQAARSHLEKLNNKINELNAQIADGLAFKLPKINPMVVDTQQAEHIDPGSGTKTPSGETKYWTGDGTGDGSKGSNGGDGTGGGRDGSDGKGDQNPGKDQDPGRDDPGQDPGKGQDDPSTGTQDPSDPQQPGNGTGTGGSPQKPGDQDQSVPPVIGADPPKTQLADAGNPTYPTTTPTTGYPQQSTPNLLTNPPTTQMPTSTPFSPVPGQSGGGPGTWYGMGGSGSGAAPAVLRGGPGTSGPGLMAYPPGGMGAGGGDQSSERDREIYDPEGDIWSSPHQTSPDRIG